MKAIKFMKSLAKRASLMAVIFSFLPVYAMAQEEAEPSLFSMDPMMLTILFLVALVMLLVFVTLVLMVNLARLMLIETEKAKARAEGIAYVEPKGIFESWWSSLSERFITGKLYSQDKERESMLLEHNYDGIQEMDYGMPPWLTTFFLITIGFGVVYVINIYGTGLIPSQSDEYIAEMEEAEIAIAEWKAAQANLIDETNVEFSDEVAHLEAGKAIYMKDCKVCHGEFGEGGVGPNMTDDYWLHGGGIAEIFSTVKYGVPEKGMISWQNQLSPADMSAVSSYIYTLHGTNPPNPKDPQGEFVKREEAGAETEEASDNEEESDAVDTEEAATEEEVVEETEAS